MVAKALACIAVALQLLSAPVAARNALAKTPPMGWMSWVRARPCLACLMM
jgi:hypothetical protein